jgi:hypothetical protein
MSQSDGEPAWQGKTYNALKDKKTLDWNKQRKKSTVPILRHPEVEHILPIPALCPN